MSKHRKRYKGIKYVAEALTKYSKSQFGNYKSALPKAREIVKELKQSKTKITLKSIFTISVKPKRVKKTKPELPIELQQPSYYFELVDYPNYISLCPSDIWFKSKLFPQGVPMIQGGTTPDYNDYFMFYVAYCNVLAKQENKEDNVYDHEWQVRCTDVVYNRSRKRWETEIISIDGTGSPADYGFNPKEPYATINTNGLPKEKTSTDIRTSKTKQTSGETTKTIEKTKSQDEIGLQVRQNETQIEIERQKNITNALKLFGEGKLTKGEFKDLMAQIKR